VILIQISTRGGSRVGVRRLVVSFSPYRQAYLVHNESQNELHRSQI
jgi:hypothetical protein